MRSILPPPVLLALLVPLSQSMVRPAFAAEPEKPWRAAYNHCQKLSNEGDYTGALEACEQAYALNADPGILAYIAQIQIALLRPVQARDALVRYLRSGSIEHEDRKTAEAQVRYLESQIGTLSVNILVEGAELRVDDQVVDAGTLARGVQLPAGAHRVTLRSKGVTFSRFIVLRGGETTQLDLPGSGTLSLSCAVAGARFFIDDREVDAAQAARGVSSAAGSHRIKFQTEPTNFSEQVVAVNPDERTHVVCSGPPAEGASSEGSGMNRRGYWVTAAGISLGIAALGTAIYNGNEYDRWQEANTQLGQNMPRLKFADAQQQAQDNDELMASIKTRRKVSIGLGIASGLVTAGGVALLFADSAAAERVGSGSWLRKLAGGVSVNGAKGSGEISWRGAW